MAQFSTLEFQRNIEKKYQKKTEYIPTKPPKRQFKLDTFDMRALDECDYTQNKTLDQHLPEEREGNSKHEKQKDAKDLQLINSQTISQSYRQTQTTLTPEIPQNRQLFTLKSLYEDSNKLKDRLQANMEALVQEIFFLDQKYHITTFTSELHPNYIAAQCIQSVIRLNQQLETSVEQLKLMNGNSGVIKFIPESDITQIEKFQELQTTQFYPTQDYLIESNNFDLQHYSNRPINVFQQSPNDMFLTCCQYSTQTIITIWYLNEAKIVKQIPYQSQITALIYYNDSVRFLIGDEEGNLAQFDSSTEQITPQLQFKIHKAMICQLILKTNDKVFSCSLDNKIQLIDILKKQILLVINNDFSCFCGFDYSTKEHFLIAPNKSGFLNLWDPTQGIKFCSLQMEIFEQNYITICLSQNSEQVLVNFFSEKKILLVQIIQNFRQLQIMKQMNLETECFNLSWCLEDQAFVYVQLYNLRVRFLGYRTIPLILNTGLPNEFVRNKRPYINKQNPQLENLIIPQGKNIYLINRKKMKNISY